jgi:anti-anti-sigma factor
MKISAQDHAHVCVLTLSGEFTADDTDAFNRALNPRLDTGSIKDVVIDCENLEFLDSAALELLLDTQDTLGAKNGQLRLVAPDQTLTTILALTRLDNALESCGTLEDAVRSLR